MLIQGSKGLKTISNLPNLIPSVVTITCVLKAIGENNAELDRDASLELRNLFIKTGEMTGNLNKVINDSLENTFKNSSDRTHIAILESLSCIDKLGNIDGDHKAKIMEKAVEENIAVRKQEIKYAGDINKIFASGATAGMVIFAASIAYKYARKPTFMESLLKLLKSF